MKTFTATQLNKAPQEIFAAARHDGVVEINHSRYPDIRFIILPQAIPRDDPYPFDRVGPREADK